LPGAVKTDAVLRAVLKKSGDAAMKLPARNGRQRDISVGETADSGIKVRLFGL
jgi:hypothetical protein